MDGVIVDSELQWKLVEGPFLKSLVPQWNDTHHEQIVGRGVLDLYRWLVSEFSIKVTQEEFLARCQEMAVEVYTRRVTLADGIEEFLKRTSRSGAALGLASSSPRAWIDLVLHRFDLRQAFSAVVSGDDVGGKTKPAPDIYLLAAATLKVDPQRCLAVEDSTLGISAAKAAGMTCAALRTASNAAQDLSSADWEFKSFREL